MTILPAKLAPALDIDAGAAGYSDTVAHPALKPSATPQRKSLRARSLLRSMIPAANANRRHAAASACPQKSVAYAQIGVANAMDSAANAAPPSLLPSFKAIKNKHAQAKAAGRATANKVTK